MQRTVEKVFFALLRFDINGTDIASVKNLITSDILPPLFQFAKKHDLAHLIGDALEKNGLFTEDSKTRKQFLHEQTFAVYHYEQQIYELEKISKALGEEKIQHVPLKGSVIREYYPQPWMRTSCDIDILVREENLAEALKKLKEIGYIERVKGSHDVNLVAPNGVHLELHFKLTETNFRWTKVFSSIWEESTFNENYCGRMPNDLFYLYHIVHMAIHILGGGCGIKPFIDLYIINDLMLTDEHAVKERLSVARLGAFEEAIKNLVEYWMLDTDESKIDQGLKNYILNGGVYGSMKNRVAVQQIEKGGKGRYFFSRIFVSYKELSLKYPSLKKFKLLFPFYQVYRWFDLFVRKKSREYTKKTLKETYKTDKATLIETEELLNRLGIK